MKQAIVNVTHCGMCPYFGDSDARHLATCGMLHRLMRADEGVFPILSICPLPDTPADYPNLRAQAQGAVSGSLTEWPQLRAEAKAALAEIARLRAKESKEQG